MAMAASGLLSLPPSPSALIKTIRLRSCPLHLLITVKPERCLSLRQIRGVSTVCNASASGALPVPSPETKSSTWSEVLGRLGGSQAPTSLSDIVWPSLGGFVAMAAMGLLDTALAPRGLSFTLGSFGAVCVLLFTTPKVPSSQKYNVIVAHLGCAAVGVLALATFGPGWVARAAALAAAIAFMLYTGSLHPPAAGLPLIMVDAQKLHHLKWWYVLYPGVVGCVFLFLLQEVVQLLKDKCRF